MEKLSIRLLRTDEWALLKELRIQALEDTPDAFAQTIDEVRDEPESYWQQLAMNLRFPHHAFFVAFVRDKPIGIAYGRLEAEERTVAHIGSMWVSPTVRGTGIGKKLLERVMSWAVEQRATRIKLWVTVGNSPATKLYESSGFVPTGVTDVLRAGSPLQIIEMARGLSPRTEK